MKRTLALALTLVLLLSVFAACTKKNDNGATESASDGTESYAALIAAYRDAFANPDPDSYDLDADPMCIEYFGDAAGYTFYDLNRDGTMELIIGVEDEDAAGKMRPIMLAGIYTLQNGKPKWLLGSADEYVNVNVLNDGRIIEESLYWGNYGEGSFATVLALKDGSLEIEKAYFSAGKYDEEREEYGSFVGFVSDEAIPYDSEGEPLTDGLQSISETEFDTAMTALWEAQMIFPVTLFTAKES